MRILVSRLLFLIGIMAGHSFAAVGQAETSAPAEQLLEAWAERDETGNEEHSGLEQLMEFRESPLNMNEASEEDLQALLILSALHIENFMRYRQVFGPLISIYELQAVPLWDISAIRQLLPYITVKDNEPELRRLREMLAAGENRVLFRYAQTPEKAKGYQASETNASRYLGNRDKLYLRYRYQFKNQLQYGVAGKKDAGEMFFNGSRAGGFDFYSFHFFLRKNNGIKALALGDYTVNLGQGLVHWQGFSAGKGADILNIKKQAAVLRPYTSSGEYNFQRGAGITWGKDRLEGTVFLSRRKLDGTLSAAGNETVITSISTAGYHRTEQEAEKKGNIVQTTTGGSFKYKGAHWHIALNGVHYAFSRNMLKKAEPYNLFALPGSRFSNMSMDYGYTHKNVHFFGEVASDNRFHTASLQGVLISLDRYVDASFIYRHTSRAYNTLYGSAFTENTRPGNEKGLYSGITIRLNTGISVAAYADVYQFPWLKYRTDAPSYGREFLLQATCKPDRKSVLYIRYRNKIKEMNESGGTGGAVVRAVRQQNVRFHVSAEPVRGITLRNRTELVWYDNAGAAAEKGFIWLADLLFKPMEGSWSANGRFVFFDTDGYNSRIYAYENDVLYAASFSPLFSTGSRYYINIRKKVTLKSQRHPLNANLYLRWSRSIHSLPGFNSGLDEISGKRKSEIKLQLIVD